MLRMIQLVGWVGDGDPADTCKYREREDGWCCSEAQLETSQGRGGEHNTAALRVVALIV
eukprot:COSAG02_NODE_67191_length_253_cov_1.012987_1_plen_58_part_10